MTKCVMSGVLALVFMASNTFAAALMWDSRVTGDWTTAGAWAVQYTGYPWGSATSPAPISGDTAMIAFGGKPIITTDVEADVLYCGPLGVGGVMEAQMDSGIATFNVVKLGFGDQGKFTMNGGVLNIAANLNVGGFGLGVGKAGQFIQNGGMVTVGNALFIGGDTAGQEALLQMNGGEMYVSNFNAGFIGNTWASNIKIDIRDGALFAFGGYDKEGGAAFVLQLVASGTLIGNGGASAVTSYFDEDLNKTVVVTPEPVTISMLALGALAVIRRKR